MSLIFLSLPLFPLLHSFSFFLLTFFPVLLADDGAVLVQATICGPLDVSKQIAFDQLLAMRLQDMVGCPVIMGIGIDRIDSQIANVGCWCRCGNVQYFISRRWLGSCALLTISNLGLSLKGQ